MDDLARRPDVTSPTGRWADRVVVAALLLAVFVPRAVRLDQPIVENYVGRQVPTAMVARNLLRGSGFLHPQLDTGPFPNLFLVEPPIAAQLAVWVRLATGLPLDASGRLVSAAGTTLAAWGLFALMVRRRGKLAAVAAVIAFASFPVTIRYGRAFQPDALALGLLVGGLACWDAPGRARAGLGAVLLALGLAQKVTWILAIVPPLALILAQRPKRVRWMAVGCVVPAVAWYVWAGLVIGSGGEGSSASADNARNWLARLTAPGVDRLGLIGRDLLIRSFTPVGFLAAAGGLFFRTKGDRLWSAWLLGGVITLVLLVGKLHHDYYWLLVSPAVAGWVGIAAEGLGRLRRVRSADLLDGEAITEVRTADPTKTLSAVVLGSVVLLGMIQSRATWRTPAEWRHAVDLAASVARHVPEDALVIAPEAIIHLGDRRGCRLEWEAGAVRRAANEWRPSPAFDGTGPEELVAFYRRVSGARYFADLDDVPADSERGRLHARLRADPRARLLDDRPGRFLLVELDGPERPTSPEARHEARTGEARDHLRLRPLEGRGAEGRDADRLRLHHGPPPG